MCIIDNWFILELSYLTKRDDVTLFNRWILINLLQTVAHPDRTLLKTTVIYRNVKVLQSLVFIKYATDATVFAI